MFGDGSRILRNVIMDSVSQGAGTERGSVNTFEQCWAAAKLRLSGKN